MPRYIKATDALCVLSEYYNYITDAENYRLAIAISKVPTADVVEVVRCKDCVHHEDEVPGMVWCPHIVGNWVNDNWFCAEGDRKDTEDV